MPRPRTYVISLLACLAAAAFSAPRPALGQPAPAKDAGAARARAASTSLSQVEAALAELEAQGPLPEEARKLVEQAQHHLAVARDARKSCQGCEAAAAQAAARQAALQQKLREVTTQPGVAEDGANTESLEQPLRDARQKLDALEQHKQELDAAGSLRRKRQEAIPKELATLRERLTSLQSTPATMPATTTQPALARAHRLAREAEVASVQAQIDARRAEQAQYEADRPILPLETRLADKQMEAQRRLVAELARRLDDSRRRDYQEALQNLPAVAPLIAQTRSLQEAARTTDARARAATAEGARLKRQAERLRLVLEDVRERFKLAGQTEEVGRLLPEQRSRLPDDATLNERLQTARRDLRDAELQNLDYQSQKADLPSDDTAAVAQVMAKVPSAQRTLETAGYVLKQVQDRTAALTKAIAAQEEYVGALKGVVEQRKQVVATAGDVRQFIDENLLWIRNAPPVGANSLAALGRAMAWLTAPKTWTRATEDFRQAVAAQPIFSGVLGILVLALLLGKRRMRRQLEAAGRAAEIEPPGSMGLLARALGWTILLAILWPAWLWALADLLASAPDAAPFTRGLAKGLTVTAALLLPIQLLRTACRANGLGRVHLRWDEGRVAAARRMPLWLLPVPPLLGLAEMTSVRQLGADVDALQRAALLVALVLSSAVVAVTLRPGNRAIASEPERGARPLARRLRWAWYALLVVGPLVLAAGATLGYLYAVRQIFGMAIATAWLAVGLVVVRDVTMRTLFHSRRWVVRRQVSRARQQEQQTETDAPPGESIRDQVSQVSAASDEASRLVRVILLVAAVAVAWVIWDDLLPALRRLGGRHLWTGSAGPVTVLHVVGGILAAALTVYAARTLPRMLDLVLLVRLRVEAGARYAIATLTRYGLLIVGVLVVAYCFGITWKSVQFVVAALGLGLGFGLQEIFANFISGIIILLERPIRVGDLVTIGDVSGRVSRIQIRATTVVDWDRKELIIPNKEFITGKMVNWTLSDRTIRLVLPVGVAYGSDTELAQQTLLELARAHPKVLSDPEPAALFLGFGDSALNFELRAYVADIDDLFPVRHAMHMAIDKAFREKNISIAFPQRDVHLYTHETPRTTAEGPGTRE